MAGSLSRACGKSVRQSKITMLWKLPTAAPTMARPVCVPLSRWASPVQRVLLLSGGVHRGIDKDKHFRNPQDNSPTIYRIDRIQNYKTLERHFAQRYTDRFQEGEMRKRIQFMYGGELQTIRFEYTGPSLESVLDRLPTAKVLQGDGKGLDRGSRGVWHGHPDVGAESGGLCKSTEQQKKYKSEE